MLSSSPHITPCTARVWNPCRYDLLWRVHNSVQRHFFGPYRVFLKTRRSLLLFHATPKTSVTIETRDERSWDLRWYHELCICTWTCARWVHSSPKVKVIEMDKANQGRILTWRVTTFSPRLMTLVSRKFSKCKDYETTDHNLSDWFCRPTAERGYSYLYITSKTELSLTVRKSVVRYSLRHWMSGAKIQIRSSLFYIVRFCLKVSTCSNWNVWFHVTWTSSRWHKPSDVCVKVENLRLMGSVLSLFILRSVSLPKGLQTVVDTVFEKGEMLDSVVRR